MPACMRPLACRGQGSIVARTLLQNKKRHQMKVICTLQQSSHKPLAPQQHLALLPAYTNHIPASIQCLGQRNILA